jgi:microcompartment protein CcmL/EutN
MGVPDRVMDGPALAGLELDSVARGLLVADELAKEAPVTLVATTPATPGRFLILFAGAEANVEYALARGRELALPHLVDDLLLAVVDPQLIPALEGPRAPAEPDAIGVLEARSALATLLAADAAAKGARVHLVQVVVSRGLHGKGFVTLAGPVGDVQAGIEAGRAVAERHQGLHASVILSRPDPAIAERVYAGRWGELAGQPLY